MKQKDVTRTLKLHYNVGKSPNGYDIEETSKRQTTSRLPVPKRKIPTAKPKRTLKPPAFDVFDINEIIITKDEIPNKPILERKKREYQFQYDAVQPVEHIFNFEIDEPKPKTAQQETDNPLPQPRKVHPLATSLKHIHRIEKPVKHCR